MYKIGKYFEKMQVIACNCRTQQTARISPVNRGERHYFHSRRPRDKWFLERNKGRKESV